MIASISAYNGSEIMTAGGKELILTSLDARAPEFYPIGSVVKILIADDGKTVSAILKPSPDEFAQYVRERQNGPIDTPIHAVDVPKPEPPSCYKSAICPRTCAGDPESCSVKKPGKKGKKSEFTTAAQIKKEETMKTEEPKQDKKIEPEPLPEGWSYPAPAGGINGIVKRTQEIANADLNQIVLAIPSHPAPKYSEEELALLRNVIAKDCTDPEFRLMMYMAKTYGLDPLVKQIWAFKRRAQDPAVIMVGRDGMLAIAHRSGQFDGMNSGVNYEKDKDGNDHPFSAW